MRTWWSKGWIKALGSLLGGIALVAMFPFAMRLMNYLFSPQTTLEHFHFSRSAAEMAKTFNLPPNDDLHLYYSKNDGISPVVVKSVELTHSRQGGADAWGFDMKLYSGSDDMRSRVRSLWKGTPGPDPYTFDSPGGALHFDIDNHELVGSGFASPEIANAYWAAALYVIYDSDKPTAAQMAVINEKKPAGKAPHFE